MKKAAIVLFWLLVWQGVELAVSNSILLAGPIQVANYLALNILKTEFWKIVLLSVMRIGTGFLLAFFTGIIAGVCSFRFPFFKELLKPVISTFKSIPVASFVVLLLIWFGSDSLSFFCSFLVAFPNVYESVLTGLAEVDKKKWEMMKVYQVSGLKRMVYLYIPAVFPYLTNSCRTCLGMSMKSGVAAEVIGTPEFSMGEQIYMAKIYLDTKGVLAWTIVVIFVSFLLEKGFLWLLKKVSEGKPFLKGNKEESRTVRTETVLGENELKGLEIQAEAIHKSYGKHTVLKAFTQNFQMDKVYCIMGASGIGKTTLLKMLAGLEYPDEGKLSCLVVEKGTEKSAGLLTEFQKKRTCKTAMVFQESRLIESLTAIENVMLTTEKNSSLTQESAKKELLKLLPKECLEKPVSQLSGGMKRRVELVRAMNAGANLILLDEPFSGLDAENKEKAIAYIKEKKEKKILIFSSHMEEECKSLCGFLVVL